MKTFFQDGTSKEEFYFLGEQPFFYIQELDGNMPDRFVYQGDSIKYKLDNELVALYDKLRDLFFPNTEQYYAELSLMPIFVQSAGQDSECALSAEQFQQYLQIEKFQNIPNFYRHLYLVDCQSYAGTIQNLLIGMEDAFINYYLRITLVRPDATPDNPNDALSIISPEVISISGLIENYFIKAYSILDMLCKIALEMEQPQNSFETYKKTKSIKTLWGARADLKINNTPNTVFEKCDLINTIESIRNEVVHNGAWELNPKLFAKFEEGEIVERYMLFPDLLEGRLECVKNRKHFFGYGTKVNDVLPQIHREYREKILNTVAILNEMSI